MPYSQRANLESVHAVDDHSQVDEDAVVQSPVDGCPLSQLVKLSGISGSHSLVDVVVL